MIDARFDKVQRVEHHPNADTLDIVTVSNYPCIVKRGEFSVGDCVFYIREDAKLMDYDAWKKWMDENKGSDGITTFNGEFFPWQLGLMKYLGTGGRVKTIKLRGMTSMGILLPVKTVCPNIIDFDDGFAKFFNDQIVAEGTGKAYLEKNFGVTHWVNPNMGVGDLNTLHAGLEEGVRVSDEENWENLLPPDLHLGATALVTKKLDGTSSTVICRPDGTYAVTTRNNTLKPESDNVYTKFTKDAVKAGLWYAKKHNVTIAFQGEVCCHSVQRMGINKDKELDNYFIYKCYFPENENWHLKMGTYGTDSHFLKVVGECNENGFNLKTVPVLGEFTVTEELLKSYNDKPASWGEGVVLNIKVDDINDMSSLVWDYKSKSREYLMKIH